MLWHEHPANQARQQRGLAPANSFWMWGGAPAQAETMAPAGAASLAAAGGGAPSWLRAMTTPGAKAVPGAAGIVVLPQLISAGAGNDWGAWLGAMQQLEHEWFAPLLAALRDGRTAELTLILTDREGWTEIRTTKNALRKFWRAQNLKNLTQ
jgi:hypothetical protein